MKIGGTSTICEEQVEKIIVGNVEAAQPPSSKNIYPNV